MKFSLRGDSAVDAKGVALNTRLRLWRDYKKSYSKLWPRERAVEVLGLMGRG